MAAMDGGDGGWPVILGLDNTLDLVINEDKISDTETFHTTEQVAYLAFNYNGNQAPIVTNPGDQTNNVNDNVNLAMTAFDANGDTLSYSVIGLPVGLSIDSSSGVITGSPNTVGSYSVNVNVADSNGDSDSANFAWTIGEPIICTTYSSTDIPQALPNGVASTSSNLTVNHNGLIVDVDVMIDMSHTWVGDLSFSLAHQASNSSVTLIDRPGVPASTYGCNNNDLLVTLDDAAALPVEEQCGGSVPTINGTFAPNSPLSAFNGLSADGTWVLTLTDHYTSEDAGTLNAWEIQVCTQGFSNQAPVVTNPGDQTNDTGDTVNLAISATDPDGDALSYSATGLPAGLSIDNNSGLISGSPNIAGSYNVTVSVADGNGGDDTVNFTWTVEVPIICTTYSSTDIPQALPNGVASTSSDLFVNNSGTIIDVDVTIDMSHAWVGDLSFILTHQATNSSVTLIDRPGVPASTYGCSADDLLVTLDDAAALPVEEQCGSSTPTINGTFAPNNPLSTFNGLNANGTWVLTVTDDYTSADSGTLNAWEVQLCTQG